MQHPGEKVMQVEEELAHSSVKKGSLLTIGVFDGVHRGHQHLISQLREHARQQSLLSGVVTFRRHPQEVLTPQIKPSFLADLAGRINLLKNEGVEIVVALSFTRELAELSPRRFIGLLKKYLRMRGLVVGPDFALGLSREGNIDALRSLSRDIDFSVTVVPPIIINGEVVSSTAIRNALANGDMERVHTLTDRPFSLHGRVITGTGRGIKLGFPTANLSISPGQALPADGVYATWAYINDKTYESMTNIGKNPTFGDNQRTVEVYVLDYHGDLYERELKIDIIERLRGEEKFNSAEELKKQVAEDVKQGRVLLSSRGRN